MGVFDNVRRRNGTRTASAFAETQQEKDDTDVSVNSPTRTLSLEARNEAEIEAHPDVTTEKAHIGVQKAEATALVWSKPALYATFAW